MRKTVSVTEYATAYDISRQAVLKKIKDNKLPKGHKATKVGHVWTISVTAK